MSQMNFVEFEKTRFTAHSFQSEHNVIQDIKLELATSGRRVTNKAIMIKLIARLETESDVVKLDIYRNALEAVVFRTPDDLV